MRIVLFGYRKELHDDFMLAMNKRYGSLVGAFYLDDVYEKYVLGKLENYELYNIFNSADIFYLNKDYLDEQDLTVQSVFNNFMCECVKTFSNDPVEAYEYEILQKFTLVRAARKERIAHESENKKFKVLLSATRR